MARDLEKRTDLIEEQLRILITEIEDLKKRIRLAGIK
jgi:hypothetical protein